MVYSSFTETIEIIARPLHEGEIKAKIALMPPIRGPKKDEE
jgi:hypothetical protein